MVQPVPVVLQEAEGCPGCLVSPPWSSMGILLGCEEGCCIVGILALPLCVAGLPLFTLLCPPYSVFLESGNSERGMVGCNG
jgi:hypothetical protein